MAKLVGQFSGFEQDMAALEKQVKDAFRASRPALAEEMRQAAVVEREYRFTVLMRAEDYDPAALGGDTILLQGVVDCWFETEDGITVVDFKTDIVRTEEDTARHAELYRGQLAAYSLALERVLGKPVTRKTLYFLRGGRTVEVA